MFTGGAEPALTASRHHKQVQGEQQTRQISLRVRVRVRAEGISDGMENAAELLVMDSHNPLASSSLQTPGYSTV